MNGVKLPFCGTNPLIVLLDSYCMSSYIYNTNMANTKKVKKVYRRTNAQMRRDEARMRREDSQQRSQMNSFLRRKIVDPIHELWERVKARDKYYIPRTIVECDDFFSGSQPDSEDEDEDSDEDSSDNDSTNGDETDSDDESTAPNDLFL